MYLIKYIKTSKSMIFVSLDMQLVTQFNIHSLKKVSKLATEGNIFKVNGHLDIYKNLQQTSSKKIIKC